MYAQEHTSVTLYSCYTLHYEYTHYMYITANSQPSTIHESSTHEGAGSGGGRREEGHRVSPVLWHSLDLWQVVRGMGHRKENDAIADLLACSTQFNIGNW